MRLIRSIPTMLGLGASPKQVEMTPDMILDESVAMLEQARTERVVTPPSEFLPEKHNSISSTAYAAYKGVVENVPTPSVRSPLFDPVLTPGYPRAADRPVEVKAMINPGQAEPSELQKRVMAQVIERFKPPRGLENWIHVNELVDIYIESDGQVSFVAKTFEPTADRFKSMANLLNTGGPRTLQYSLRAKEALSLGTDLGEDNFDYIAAIWGISILADTHSKFSISGVHHVEAQKPYVVTPTHDSMAEYALLFLTGLLTHQSFGFVADAKFKDNALFNSLLGDTMLKSKRFFFIYRETPKKVQKNIEALEKVLKSDPNNAVAKEVLEALNSEFTPLGTMKKVQDFLASEENRFSVIIYPQGTRANVRFDEEGNRINGDLYIKQKGLKIGPFRLAAESGLSVLPMAFDGVGPFMPSGFHRVQQNSEITLYIGEPISTDGLDGDDSKVAIQLKDKVDAFYREYRNDLLPKAAVEKLERGRAIGRELRSLAPRKIKGLSKILGNAIKDRFVLGALSFSKHIQDPGHHLYDVQVEQINDPMISATARMRRFHIEDNEQVAKDNPLYQATQQLADNPLTQRTLQEFFQFYEEVTAELRTQYDEIAKTTESNGISVQAGEVEYQQFSQAIDHYLKELDRFGEVYGMNREQLMLAVELRTYQDIERYPSDYPLEELGKYGYAIGALKTFPESAVLLPRNQLASILDRVFGDDQKTSEILKLYDTYRESDSLKARRSVCESLKELIAAYPERKSKFVRELSLHHSVIKGMFSGNNHQRTQFVERFISAFADDARALSMAEHLVDLHQKIEKSVAQRDMVRRSQLQREFDQVLSVLGMNYAHMLVPFVLKDLNFGLPMDDIRHLQGLSYDVETAKSSVGKIFTSRQINASGLINDFNWNKDRALFELQYHSLFSVVAGRSIEDLGRVVAKSKGEAAGTQFYSEVMALITRFPEMPSQRKSDEAGLILDQYRKEVFAFLESYSGDGIDVEATTEAVIKLADYLDEFRGNFNKYEQKLSELQSQGLDVQKVAALPNGRDMNRVREKLAVHVLVKLDRLASEALKKQGMQKGAREPIAPLFSTIALNTGTMSLAQKAQMVAGAAKIVGVTVPRVQQLVSAVQYNLSADVMDSMFMGWSNFMDNQVHNTTLVRDEEKAKVTQLWPGFVQVLKHSSWMDFSQAMTVLRSGFEQSGDSVLIEGTRILAKLGLGQKNEMKLIGPAVEILTIPVGNKMIEFLKAEDRGVISMTYGDVPEQFDPRSAPRPGERPTALFPELTMPVGDMFNIFTPSWMTLRHAPQSQTVNLNRRALEMMLRRQGLTGKDGFMMLAGFQNSFHRFPKPDATLRLFFDRPSRNLMMDMIALSWLPTPAELEMNRSQWSETMNNMVRSIWYDHMTHPENY